ncbi:uncharacterized protein BDV17DRAFT_23685 [Aspergillus undulatus]|uniref:uncharacterized protein n=1 Tax=Aspergillus undulatus TaxID=1810928 RepID=UPI003CCCD509
MLRPFLIRDLHEDSQLHDIIEDTASDLYNATDVSVGPQRRHGLVQLAAADYDEIAYTHPQARLTYLDEDDGDIITIGSSLELAQRLDEPPSQTTDTFPATIHLFDIRRRQSITDLWKKFEYNEHASVRELTNTDVAIDSLEERATASQSQTSTKERSNVQHEQANTATDDTSESFLSAFETEMAKLMNESRRLDSNPEGASSSRATQAESIPNLPRETAEAFASALRSLMEVAESISSGVKARIPELERHLDNARRSLPGEITDSMRNAFLAFEAQVRAMATTINNIPESISRENGPGNSGLFSELPTPNGVFNGLREMSVQLGGLGQMLVDTIYESSRGAFPGQASNPFFNFPNLPESNNNLPAVPNNAREQSRPQHDMTSGSGNTPPTMPTSNAGSHETPGFQARPGSVPGSAPGSTLPRAGSQTYPIYNDIFGGAHRWSDIRPPFILHSSPPPASAPTNPGPDASSQPQPSIPEHPAPSLEPHSSRSLFIGNVGFNVTEKMVKDVFTSKGLRLEVNLPQDSRTNQHAGFGYLTFESGVEASLAMRALQGVIIDGHCINLEYIDHAPIMSLNREPEESNAATGPSPQTSVVRHEDADDALASAPDNTDPKPNRESVHDLLAQTEARFPPVSQLDAHIVAGQSSKESQSTTSQTRTVLNTGDARPTPRESAGSSQLPGSFPQDVHDGPSETSRDFEQESPTLGLSRRLNAFQECFLPPVLPPSNPSPTDTTRVPEDQRSFDASGSQPRLSHRATECHSYQPIPTHRIPSPPRFREPNGPQPLRRRPKPAERPSCQPINHRQSPRGVIQPIYPQPLRRRATEHHSYQPIIPHPPLRGVVQPIEPQPLRRRATERHSLRDSSHMGPRHRASFHHLSQPTPEQAQPTAILGTHEEEPASQQTRNEAKQQQRQRAMDECVSRLVEMGFGNEEDGGTQRLSVYAAAAKCDLFGAIDMIEEEREAYKQRK